SGTLSLTGAVTSSGTITAGTGFAVQMTGGGNLGGTIGAATATGTITAKAGAFTTSASLSLADEASATTLHLATGWT
ncbi:hypothetical protein VJI77_07815, partial [Parvimonas sp. D2]|uniref:hypothetical protein n=1 Tax=Parvimonas sp. D2 TaxID=3110691 RepID=UPI002B463ECA